MVTSTSPTFSPLVKDTTTGKITHTVNNPFATTSSTGSGFSYTPTAQAAPVDPISGYSAVKSSLPAPNQIDVQSTYNMFADKGPESVVGLDKSYFQAERDRRREDLRNEFFGPRGVLNQNAYNESGAGRLGSGVGTKMLEATVTNPFAQEYATIDRDVAQQEFQEIARVQETNAKLASDYNTFLGNLATADSGNYLQAQIANNELEMSLNDLAARLGSDYAKQMNDYEIKAYENYLDSLKIELENYQFEKEQATRERELDWKINT